MKKYSMIFMLAVAASIMMSCTKDDPIPVKVVKKIQYINTDFDISDPDTKFFINKAQFAGRRNYWVPDFYKEYLPGDYSIAETYLYIKGDAENEYVATNITIYLLIPKEKDIEIEAAMANESHSPDDDYAILSAKLVELRFSDPDWGEWVDYEIVVTKAE